MFGGTPERQQRNQEKEAVNNLIEIFWNTSDRALVYRNQSLYETATYAFRLAFLITQVTEFLPTAPSIYHHAAQEWRERIEAERGNPEEVASLFVSFGNEKEKKKSIKEKALLLSRAYSVAAQDAQNLTTKSQLQQKAEVIAQTAQLIADAPQDVRR